MAIASAGLCHSRGYGHWIDLFNGSKPAGASLLRFCNPAARRADGDLQRLASTGDVMAPGTGRLGVARRGVVRGGDGAPVLRKPAVAPLADATYFLGGACCGGALHPYAAGAAV